MHPESHKVHQAAQCLSAHRRTQPTRESATHEERHSDLDTHPDIYGMCELWIGVKVHHFRCSAISISIRAARIGRGRTDTSVWSVSRQSLLLPHAPASSSMTPGHSRMTRNRRVCNPAVRAEEEESRSVRCHVFRSPHHLV